MGDEASLRQAVEEQAQARVDGDFAKFASYMTPQALLRLHRQGEPLRAGEASGAMRLSTIRAGPGTGDSDVRYSGSGSYVLRTRWERPDGLWKAVMVEMPADSIRSSVVAPDAPAGARAQDPPAAERRDLR